MYARIVESTATPGQAGELHRISKERVIPIVRQQAGFVDGIVLISDTDRDRSVAISLWKSKEDHDKYVAGQLPQILQFIRPLLQNDPIVRTFNVEASTSHNIGIGLAASTT
jgi:hypothetical protein